MKKSITIFSFSILSSLILLYFISLVNLFIFQGKIEDTNYMTILIMQIVVFIFPIFFISKMFLIEIKDIIPINLNISIKNLLIMLLCALIIEFFVNSFQNIIIEILPKFIRIVLEESEKFTLDFYKKILNFDNILQFFTIIFVVAIVPSISEELYFRGLLYKSLEQFNFITICLITSFVFAFFHLQLINFLTLFFIGLYLCFIRNLTNNIIYSILIHFFINIKAILLTKLNLINPYKFGMFINFIILIITFISIIFILKKFKKLKV